MSIRRPSSSPRSTAVGSSEQDRLVTDRAQYIAFLEAQLERVSAACQNVAVLDDKLDHLKGVQHSYELKITNLAKLVKLGKEHSAKVKSETGEYTEAMKKRLVFLEEKTREKFDQSDERMARIESMYAAFPTDANAHSSNGSSAPAGLPGFIANYVHSLFAQHTQQTAQSLTQQAQTHQIHLQNWVQEYIKTTHPSTRLLEDLAALKAEHATLATKVADSEARMIATIERKMAGYTEVYQTVEERFLSVVDVHHRKVCDDLAELEEKMKALAEQQEASSALSTRASAETVTLSTDLLAQRTSTTTFLDVVGDMKTKLDSGILDFNTNLNSLVLELREKTWHAEQTVSRLAVDTVARQNVFHKKIEAQLESKHAALTNELQTELDRARQMQGDIQASLAAYEKKMEKSAKKTDNRMQILANTLRDKFDDESSGLRLTGDANPAVLNQLNQLDVHMHQVESRLQAIRREMESQQEYVKAQCETVMEDKLASLHVQLDKEIEDKIYLVERANHAHNLARKTEALASGGDAAASAPSLSGRPEPRAADDWRAIKAELNTEIKKNLSAMHVTLEEKLKLVEKKSNLSTLEQSRAIGASLQALEDKNRAADDTLQKVQALYQAMQGQFGGQQTPPLASSAPAPSRPHRPASPTVYAKSTSMPAPPRSQSPPTFAASASAAPAAQPTYPHPPTFAATLPYYHDPRDPAQPYLANSQANEGAFVPPAAASSTRPNPIHQYPAAAALPPDHSEVIRQADVRRAADSALARTLSPLRHRSGSPPTALFAQLSPVAAIHHHSVDDLYLNRPSNSHSSKPYALIPSHFPSAAAPTSYFDPNRSRDDSDLLTDKALTTGLGNIDQLLRSMEFMEQAEKKKRTSRARTAKPIKPWMKRTGGGFVAPNLLQGGPLAGYRARSKSPYQEEVDEDAFLKQSRYTRAGRHSPQR